MRYRLPVVGVLGSGRQPCEPQASTLGSWLARIGVHLLTGGGRGVMEGVSRGFCSVPERKGLSIGIIPARRDDETNAYAGPKTGYPNAYIELPIQTHLHRSGEMGTDYSSRNHINVLTSNLLIALPGGSGTSSEVLLAVTTYHRPVIAYVSDRVQIPNLPECVRAESELENIQKFIIANLAQEPGFEYSRPVDS